MWTLLGFITYLLYTSGGLHNIALLAIPICLVFAGIALQTEYFFAFTLLSVLSVVVIGSLEISGMLVNQFSHYTNFLDVVDIAVILSMTAVAVRILADNLLRSIHKARTREKEIRQQSEELRESEEKFRTLTEELPNMVFILKNGRVVYVNEKSKDLIGYSREEIYAPEFDFLSIIAPEHRDFVTQKLRQHMAGFEIEPYEVTLIGVDNKKVECLNMSKLIHFEGEPSVLGMMTDLTELKGLRKKFGKVRAGFHVSSLRQWKPLSPWTNICTSNHSILLPNRCSDARKLKPLDNPSTVSLRFHRSIKTLLFLMHLRKIP